MGIVIFLIGVIVGVVIDTIVNIFTMRKLREENETLKYALDKISNDT